MVEKVLQWPPYNHRATCVSVVGQDIVIAVHGEASKVFGLSYDDQVDLNGSSSGSRRDSAASTSTSHGRRSTSTSSRPSSRNSSRSGTQSGRESRHDEVNTERPITPDAAACFNIATAIEIALKAFWLTKEYAGTEALEAGKNIRLGGGIAFGSKTVCGLLSSGSSAHRWNVFGDGASEA